MIFPEWMEFWWNNVTGPRAAITKVVDFLLDRNIVILTVPDDLPWRHDMRSAIEMGFKNKATNLNMIIEQIDVADDCPNVEPGKYLLQRFAPSEISKAYRERAGIPLQQYMIDHVVLKNTIVWIKGMDSVQAPGWVSFCTEYAPTRIENGLIILEIHEGIPFRAHARVKTVSLTDFVSNHDLRLFTNLILHDNQTYPETWKRYVSTLVTRLCGIDAEVAESLVNTVDFQTEQPMDGIRQIAESPEFERRGRGDSRHVLARYRAGDSDELNKRIWSAQVQVLFPLIEFERLQIMDRWSQEIQEALDTYVIKQYHQVLDNPLDMELGTFIYHFSTKADEYNYYIYIPDENARDRTRFLRDCRNTLAHANCLAVEQINALIKGAQAALDPP